MVKSFKIILKQGLMLGRKFIRNKFSSAENQGFSSRNKLKCFGDYDKHTFFGYYDLSPFNHSLDKLLACRIPRKAPSDQNIIMDVGFYNINNSKKFIKVGETHAWSWQQTCRLQWFSNSESNHSSVIYNSLIDNKYNAILKNIESKKVLKTYDLPIYCLSPNYDFALSLDFSRLELLRPGYGYTNLDNSIKLERSPKDTGISRINLSDNTIVHILSLEDIKSFKKSDNNTDAYHYVNHIHFSPNGKNFIFFHIAEIKNNRRIRLILSDLNGKKLKVLVKEEFGLSHYNWVNDNELILYLFNGPSGRGYYFLDTDKLEYSKINLDTGGLDGHPTVSADRDFIITDTLPDRYSERSLLRYNLGNGNKKKLGSFDSLLKLDNSQRCDLHPRLSHNGDMVAFDSEHEGYRKLYVLSL